jgi:hypothetical protein
MLKLNATKARELFERPVVTGSTIGAEGMALIRSLVSGEEHVKPSTGVGGEVFVGFSFSHNLVPSTLSRVESVDVPASPGPYTVTLERNNLVAANIMIVRDSDSVVLTEGDATNADEYSVVDVTGIITFNSADAEETMTVTYRYSPTTVEAKFEYPDADVNINAALEFINSVGVIGEGEVYTDQFDAAVDWDSASAIKLGTSGIVTTSGSGETITDARVIHVPDVDNPFLGISF